MVINASSPMGYMIKEVFVDDVLMEDVLQLDPSEGWVEIHDSSRDKGYFQGSMKMLKYDGNGNPVKRRVKGRVRITWHERK